MTRAEKLEQIVRLRERAHNIAQSAERAPTNEARNSEMAGARKLLAEADALEKSLSE
jgi:hypothetical protein